MAESYDKSKDLMKGEALLVFVGGKPIAYAKKHDFKVTPNMHDVSSKFSGKYKEQMPGEVDWSISVDSLVSATKGHTSAAMLRQLAASGAVVEVQIAAFTIADNPTGKEITIGTVQYNRLS